MLLWETSNVVSTALYTIRPMSYKRIFRWKSLIYERNNSILLPWGLRYVEYLFFFHKLSSRWERNIRMELLKCFSNEKRRTEYIKNLAYHVSMKWIASFSIKKRRNIDWIYILFETWTYFLIKKKLLLLSWKEELFFVKEIWKLTSFVSSFDFVQSNFSFPFCCEFIDEIPRIWGQCWKQKKIVYFDITNSNVKSFYLLSWRKSIFSQGKKGNFLIYLSSMEIFSLFFPYSLFSAF